MHAGQSNRATLRVPEASGLPREDAGPAAPTAAPTASTPEAAPARFSISSGPGGTITEQTASVLAAGRLERAPEQKQAVDRPDIAELVAAFTAQFAGSERRNLEMLL